MANKEPRGWYSRGYLPHIDAGAVPQFLTWRLADSCPAELIEKWREELRGKPEEERKQQLYSRVEKYLDQGLGSCVLRNPIAGRIVQDGLLFYHLVHYDLHAWSVMPNHVHCLLTPYEGVEFETFLKPLKGYTSREINKAFGGRGNRWQVDFFDRLIRDEGHFHRVSKYIEWNPVKAGLCSDPKHWAFSSANEVAMGRVHEKVTAMRRAEGGQIRDQE